jgi:L-iditol 2-dehydrogenase
MRKVPSPISIRLQRYEQAIEIVKPGGRIILVGISPDVARISSDFIVRKEIEIFGSFIYTHDDFSHAIQLISEKRVRLVPLMTHRFSLKDIGEAFDIADKKQGIKVMINPNKETG